MTEQIPKTQMACCFTKHGSPDEIKVVKDHPVTQQKDLKPGEALICIEYTGVCHTDFHALKGDWPVPTKSGCLIGGHEGAGRIVAIGEGSTTTFQVGSRVGVAWVADACMDCEACREGCDATCPAVKTSGYSVDGTFQQYVVSYLRHLIPIPDGLSSEVAAPIMCAGVTVWKAIKQSGTKPRDYILISGAGGGLGHLAVQYAAAMSLRVIAVDTGAEKKALCDKYGAETFIDFKDSGNMIDRIKQASGGLGPHASIIASSKAEAYNQALAYLRPNGTLVAIGLPPDTVVSANVFWTVFKALRIVGSLVGNRQDAVESLDFAARGKVVPQITVEPLENLRSVYERMEKGAV